MKATLWCPSPRQRQPARNSVLAKACYTKVAKAAETRANAPTVVGEPRFTCAHCGRCLPKTRSFQRIAALFAISLAARGYVRVDLKTSKWKSGNFLEERGREGGDRGWAGQNGKFATFGGTGRGGRATGQGQGARHGYPVLEPMCGKQPRTTSSSKDSS